MVHASRYRELAPLIAELTPDLTEVARQLPTDVYQAVAAMMAKLGETDAAWIAADRTSFIAEMRHDRLAGVAASLFRMAHVFLTLRHTTGASGTDQLLGPSVDGLGAGIDGLGTQSLAACPERRFRLWPASFRDVTLWSILVGLCRLYGGRL